MLHVTSVIESSKYIRNAQNLRFEMSTTTTPAPSQMAFKYILIRIPSALLPVPTKALNSHCYLRTHKDDYHAETNHQVTSTPSLHASPRWSDSETCSLPAASLQPRGRAGTRSETERGRLTKIHRIRGKHCRISSITSHAVVMG